MRLGMEQGSCGNPLCRTMREGTLADEDFAELTSLLLEVADKHAGGRLVSVLEGGYNLKGLASAATAHIKTLVGARRA